MSNIPASPYPPRTFTGRIDDVSIEIVCPRFGPTASEWNRIHAAVRGMAEKGDTVVIQMGSRGRIFVHELTRKKP